MIKKIVFGLISLFGNVCLGQVGINTQTPKTTLDITAKTTDGSKPEGLLVPRLTGDQIKAGDSQYGSAQAGALVYATATSTVASVKTAAITSPGYYYFDGTLWKALGSSTAAFQSIRGKVTTVTSASYIVAADDFIIVTNFNSTVNITFPSLTNTADDIGRLVYVFNNNTTAIGVTYTGVTSGNPVTNQTRGRTFVWTGTLWVNIGT